MNTSLVRSQAFAVVPRLVGIALCTAHVISLRARLLLGPNLGPTWLPRRAKLTPRGAPETSVWALEAMLTAKRVFLQNRAPALGENTIFKVLGGPSWPKIALSWAQVGPMLAKVGLIVSGRPSKVVPGASVARA